MNVLIADDDTDIIEILTSAFLPLGFEVAAAHSSHEAIEICQKKIFDAYIIDMLMPDNGGEHVLQYLSNLLWTPLVLAITGYDNIAAESAFANKVQAFFRKPFQTNDLIDTIQYHFSQRGGVSIGKLLSKRELEILAGISSGQSSKEIADRLFLSARTVEKHRENILNKLDAKNTAELISKTFRQIS